MTESPWFFCWSLRFRTRFNSLSTLVCGTLVLKFGSLGQFRELWPCYKQHLHFTFFKKDCWFVPKASISSSSFSSRTLCLLNLHPRASFFVLPQHHHISPLNSEWCVRHDQLKFESSLYSFAQFLHSRRFFTKSPRFSRSLTHRYRNFSLSLSKSFVY